MVVFTLKKLDPKFLLQRQDGLAESLGGNVQVLGGFGYALGGIDFQKVLELFLIHGVVPFFCMQAGRCRIRIYVVDGLFTQKKDARSLRAPLHFCSALYS